MGRAVSYSKAIRRDLEVETGHPSDVMDSLRARVAGLFKVVARGRQGRKAIIGRTSGPGGLRERWNDKYKDLKYNNIVPLYKTRSIKYAREVEATLIDTFWYQLSNQQRGAAGDVGDNSTHTVYIAYQAAAN